MGAGSALRDAGWLTADRARGYCRILAAMSLLGVCATLALSHGGLDAGGKPLGTDFVSFFAAGRLAATDGATAAYDTARHAAAQQAVFPHAGYGYTTFLYPPVFLLLILPFAALPYLAALAAWLAAGLAALFAAMRPLLPPGFRLALLAYPALLVNAGHGQNAMLTAACFAGYMALAAPAPFLAGACLGCLIIKPQLALAVPFILLSARRWHALVGAAVTAIALALLTTLLLGPHVWTAFAAAAPGGQPMLVNGLNGFAKMPSLFAGLRLLGAGAGLAAACQAALAACVLAAACAIALRRPGGPAEGALMASAALLITPWSFDYDLVLLAPPMAWLASQGVARGFLPWEKSILLAAFLLPLFARALANAASLPLGPPVLALLFCAVCRRAWGAHAARAETQALAAA